VYATIVSWTNKLPSAIAGVQNLLWGTTAYSCCCAEIYPKKLYAKTILSTTSVSGNGIA
jgi:hypothetical protein